MMTGYRNLTRICLAAVLAFGLAACGGGGDEKSDAELEMERLAAAEAACTSDHGRWNADNTCTSAAELVAEAAEMNCEAGGGRWNADGSCTSAADVEAERLAQAEMDCTGAGGRWNADDTCTSAADQVTEAAQMVCEGTGGRWNADHTCTSAADLADEMEEARLAQAEMDCTGAGGRWNADDTCTPAADLEMQARTACTADGGRYEDDGSCTSAAELERMEMERVAGLRMDCEGAGGRFEDDESCTSAAELVTEAAQMNCEAGGGRYESDGSCTSAAELAAEQLERDRMACASADGRWNDDDTCTSAADLVKEDVAAAAMSKKLYEGIGSAPLAISGDGTRTTTSDAAGVVSVTMGTATVPLAEDKKTTVVANHGWEGKRHTAEPDGAPMGTFEAYVYSNVGDPTEGDPFNEEYTLATTATPTVMVGELAINTADAEVAGRVDSSSFDQTAGSKPFELPTNMQRVVLSGSYHGVSGTYYCTPSNGETCMSTIAASGFTLTGGTWAFKPTTATDKVMSVDDMVYASYGWWLHKSEDGNVYTASAFAASRGTVTAASGITALRGTATYMGGAAGKYALYSSTGGTNDVGHFTARATLETDFNDDMITGTIDNFMGADGESRPWSVELMKQGVGDTGTILGDTGTGTAGTDEKMTKWTIDGTTADPAGQWSGTLYSNGDDDGVPEVGTGTFHSEYSTSGRMVGAFGVTKQ